MINILITGASGFIGKHLVPALIGLGHNVIETSSKSGDIADEATWLRFPKADLVIHLAGKSFVPDSWENPTGFMRSNVMGIMGALNYCKKHNAVLIFLSSYLYGNPAVLPISEEAPIVANNPYALSKKFSEELCCFYSSQFGLKINILRLFNVYGTGQGEQFLIPTIIRKINNREIISIKDLEPKRDYVYIKDVVRAMMLSIKLQDGFNIFNIGSGESYSVEQLIQLIQKIKGTNLPVISSEERRKDEIMNTIADIKKAKLKLNWEPQWSLYKGLSEIISEKTLLHKFNSDI